MKRNLILAAILLCSTSIFAQEAQTEQPKLWKWSGIIGLNANGTGMVNWAAGGNNNVAGDVFGKLNCNYDKDALSWEAKLDVDYGLTYVDQQNDKLQKTSDHLNFDTKFGWAFQPKWYLTVNAGFHTQFDLGRKYEGLNDQNQIISNILAPSYTDISVGFDYKPVEFFSLYMSPVSGRITTAYLSDKVNKKYSFGADAEHDLRHKLQESYGTWYFDDLNKKQYRNYRAELGLNIKASLNYKYKDLTLMSNLTLFTPYAWDKVLMYKDQSDDPNFITQTQYDQMADKSLWSAAGYRDNGRRFGNFDVDWDLTLSYQFLKCLNITLFTNLKYVNGQKIDKVYDKGLETEHVVAAERVQFLSNLGIGVGYSF
ncbi:MAG: DUF3078 domain-containing protein [Paludibacteraceae bacterium]|nr:DUF3078 domain-containing protein [Paludibacteraceae bacterium]